MSARILIIEDDPASLELVAYLLSSAGHTVMSATDGAEGLRIAHETAPDLVLCDMHLPELNGFEVLHRLRAEPAGRSVPVVAVTAFSMPGDREAALAAGFSGYLTKPLTPESFVHEIDTFLSASLRSA